MAKPSIGANSNRSQQNGIEIEILAEQLGRSTALLRLAAKRLKIDASQGSLTVSDAVHLIRYFSTQKYDQSQVLEQQAAVIEEAHTKQLEYAVALEIVRRERAMLETQVQQIQERLQIADQRNDRLEGKIDDLVQSLAYLVDQRDRLVAGKNQISRARLIHSNGREVLLLENPVGFH